jgi:hypothetical protein
VDRCEAQYAQLTSRGGESTWPVRFDVMSEVAPFTLRRAADPGLA